MLECKIDFNKIKRNCGECKICEPKSKLVYPFERDLTTSEELVEELKKLIGSNNKYSCSEPEIVKNPDIRVFDKDGKLVCRVEAKYLEGKAFVKARDILGDKLQPRETLVLDEPKLLSYFECKRNDAEKYDSDIPIYIVWKFDRPCSDIGGITVFQEVEELKKIYEMKGADRRYERKIGNGDIVDGEKRGITLKYHFSLLECRPIEELTTEIWRQTGKEEKNIIKCLICGANMVMREGQYGKFYGCSTFPKCRGTLKFRELIK